MFDTKILLVIAVVALVVFGAKRLRTLGSDLGASVRDFKHAVGDDQPEGGPRESTRCVGSASRATTAEEHDRQQ